MTETSSYENSSLSYYPVAAVLIFDKWSTTFICICLIQSVAPTKGYLRNVCSFRISLPYQLTANKPLCLFLLAVTDARRQSKPDEDRPLVIGCVFFFVFLFFCFIDKHTIKITIKTITNYRVLRTTLKLHWTGIKVNDSSCSSYKKRHLGYTISYWLQYSTCNFL